MPANEPRVDSYIHKSAAFAQPILQHLRKLVHDACPAVTETIKWSCPHFEYKNEILCSMASFKQHCAFTIRKAALLKDEAGILEITERGAMGHLGRITSLKDLPKDSLLKKLIKQAAQLNEEGIKLPAANKSAGPSKSVILPVEILKALKNNQAVLNIFEQLAPSHQREYIKWITEAKTSPTKEKRITTMMQWLAEGKSRNWKYEK